MTSTNEKIEIIKSLTTEQKQELGSRMRFALLSIALCNGALCNLNNVLQVTPIKTEFEKTINNKMISVNDALSNTMAMIGTLMGAEEDAYLKEIGKLEATDCEPDTAEEKDECKCECEPECDTCHM